MEAELSALAEQAEIVRLLDAARNSASAQDIQKLMEAVTPEILGLTTPARIVDGAHVKQAAIDQPHVIRTHTIYEGPDLELVIFFFPQGARLPLHDHPAMTVHSKVLYGSLAMRSLDWEEAPTEEDLQAMSNATSAAIKYDVNCGGSIANAQPPVPPAAYRPAVCSADTVLTPEAPTVCLTPSCRNIHSFEALRTTAVLDLLTPPYDEHAGRDCHYFELLDAATLARNERVMLRVIPSPPSLVIVRAHTTSDGRLLDPALSDDSHAKDVANRGWCAIG